jgi:LmbE family N-acetylglucosaminyl deacetylase
VPKAVVIVAHPDDESLWCGGWILQRPDWDWFVLTLCRASDAERARKFESVLRYLGATGAMGDLDDAPAQVPLDPELVRDEIFEALPRRDFDVILTHGPHGEYTRHLRHEECSRAVVSLWTDGRLKTQEMKRFAYHDRGPGTLPEVRPDADERYTLDAETFARKLHIMIALYGFAPASWEARATPATEGFYCSALPTDVSRSAIPEGAE